MNKGRVVGWTIVILIGLGIGGFFVVRSIVRGNKVKPFNEHLSSYLKQAKAPAGPGAIKGKFVPVDMDGREIDYFYFDLPDELRPETPDEVGAVVQMRWAKVDVGLYDNKTPARVHTCAVIVKDKATGAQLAQEAFVGSDPPKSISSRSSEGIGNKPTEKIIDFLKRLPRK